MVQAGKRERYRVYAGLLFAIVAVMAAFLVRQLLVQYLGSELPTFLTFYPAVIIVAILSGFWPGLLATALSSLLTWYWIYWPTAQFRIAKAADGISLVIFFVMGVFISVLAERYRLYARRLSSFESEQKLGVMRMKLEAALASMTDAVFISDAAGRFIDFNDAFVSFFKFKDRAECIRSFDEIPAIIDVTTADGKTVPMEMWAVPRALRGETCTNVEQALRRKDTGEIWMGSFSFGPIRDKRGTVAGAVVTARDITERKRAELALKASEARYRIAFHTSIDCVNINRIEDGMYIDVNDGFTKITGYEAREALGKTSLELNMWADANDRKRFAEELRQHSMCRDFEARFRAKDGRIFWGLVSSTVIELNGVPCHFSITRDITEAKIAAEKIRNLASFDPLTGLANRSLLMEHLQKCLNGHALHDNKRALLIIDLDNFKMLNDTMGHQTGDLVLRETGRRLSACARETDTVGRLGGDEFVAILEDLSETPEEAATQAAAISEKVLAAMEVPYMLDGHEHSGTCSIGITLFGNDQKDMNEVLQQADIAMYQAKAAGRNTARFFAPALQAAVNARAVMEEDLRQGIKAGQFVLHYQPQIKQGRLTGVEALVRWKHPRHGLLYPGAFIALAEETRLIVPLGNWVLDTACRQIAAWAHHEQAATLTVSVNISALQLRKPDFVEHALKIIEQTGANPHNLELELTETMLAENVEDVIAKMTALKSHGVKFSVDDFGTGYSSLTYLKRLPLDQLKIDQSFVRDVVDDAGSSAIAQTIIDLSKAMNMEVIAEGVETVEQMNFLAHMGCYSYQGYLFSRPLPLDDFELLMPNFIWGNVSITE